MEGRGRGGGCTHEHVDALDDVEENFVLAVSDTFCAPGYSIGDCHRRACLDLEFVRFLCDVSRV